MEKLRNFSHHLARMPASESEIVQLGRGELNIRTTLARGMDSITFVVSSEPRSTWMVNGYDDWAALMLPLAWQDDFKVNGWLAQKGDVYFLDGKSDYMTLGEKRLVAFLALRKSRLRSEVSGLANLPDYSLPKGHQVFSVGLDQSAKFEGLVRSALAQASETRQFLVSNTLSDLHEADLFHRAATWLFDVQVGNGSKPLRTSSALNHVRPAREAFSSIPVHKLSVASMCRAAGVGKSQLHESFVELYGLSPWQYVKRRRLCQARERLTKIESPPNLVKSVSLEYGFRDGGRFAQEYLSLFGELPSSTLSKTWVATGRMDAQ